MISYLSLFDFYYILLHIFLKLDYIFQDFISQASVRQSYWARNFVGHPRFSTFRPNSTHFTIAQWEQKEKVAHVVTQNVDGLHQKAGSRKVTELHG